MSLRKAGAAVCKCIPLVPYQKQGEKRRKLSCKYMYFKSRLLTPVNDNCSLSQNSNIHEYQFET